MSSYLVGVILPAEPTLLLEILALVTNATPLVFELLLFDGLLPDFDILKGREKRNVRTLTI